jgi:hypothetical protein
MRESIIEQYLINHVQAHGGATRKFISPGRRGVVDRLVLFPGGRIYFVETKAPGKKPRPAQAREHTRLWALGFSVCVLDTKEKVDTFLKGVKV